MTEHASQDPSLIPGPDHPLSQKQNRYGEALEQLSTKEAGLETRSHAGRLLGKLSVSLARNRVNRARRSYSGELLRYKRPGYKPLDRE